MSLTSYRAAPPRVGLEEAEGRWALGKGCRVVTGSGWSVDLAATYSPASLDAVPWARRGFTAEFGMDRVGHPRHGHQVDRPPRRSGRRSEIGWPARMGLLRPLLSAYCPLEPASLAWAVGVEIGSDLGSRFSDRCGCGGRWRGSRSIGRLGPVGSNASPRFHFRPIDVVVCHGPDRETWFGGGFPA